MNPYTCKKEEQDYKLAESEAKDILSISICICITKDDVLDI